MLMLTPTALEVVRTITSGDGMPDDAGLRFFTADGADTLQLAVAVAPGEQDQVLTTEGSRIFLDQQAAAFLDDKILDTGQDANGEGGFVISQQEPLV
jgi:iron-sulfur cluster assembly protein